MNRFQNDTEFGEGEFTCAPTGIPSGFVGVTLNNGAYDDGAFESVVQHFTPERALEIADALTEAAFKAKPELAHAALAEDDEPEVIDCSVEVGSRYYVADNTRSEKVSEAAPCTAPLGAEVQVSRAQPDEDGEVYVTWHEGSEGGYVLPEGLILASEVDLSEPEQGESPVEDDVYVAESSDGVLRIHGADLVLSNDIVLPPVEDLPLGYALDVVCFVAQNLHQSA